MCNSSQIHLRDERGTRASHYRGGSHDHDLVIAAVPITFVSQTQACGTEIHFERPTIRNRRRRHPQPRLGD